MTIKASKQYDQHAHDQPTQASEWASMNGAGADWAEDEFERRSDRKQSDKMNAPQGGGGGMGADTRKLMASAAAGEAPWSHSYNATGHLHRGAV